MRLLGFLLLLVSNISFAQKNAEISCHPQPRPTEESYRISISPQKIGLHEIDSTVQDSTGVSTVKDQNKLVVSFPEINVLYAGFQNIMYIGFQDKKLKNIRLECNGCDTVFRRTENTTSDWLIRASDTDKVTLRVYDKKEKLIHEAEIPVFSPPAPTVYLDDTDAQSVLDELPKQIRLKYNETVPLSIKFLVKRWEIKINNVETFVGYGSAIQEKIHDLMLAETNGIITINLTFLGPDGECGIKEMFEFDLN